ncbi:MAG: tol-pal system-associated acyl-CoA thioesterase [Pseudomonadales bacterium]
MAEAQAVHFELPLRVYIEDTDAGGIVYYINYLKFMERARTELLRSLGFAKTAILGEDLMFVVHSAQINYKRPARLDELLSVSATIAVMRRSYLIFKQTITRDSELICAADVKVACVDRQGLRPKAMPTLVQAEIKNLIANSMEKN